MVNRVELKNGHVVAVKTLFGHHAQLSTRARLLSLEAAWTWLHLHHSNIVPFLGIVDFGTMFSGPHAAQLGLITPWMPDGNIVEFLGKHPASDKFSLLVDAISGLSYLHEQKPPIIHGGLQGGNILIKIRDGHPVPMLRDFGHRRAAQIYAEDLEDRTVIGLPLGDPRWLAVERLWPMDYDLDYGGGDSTASDVFELLRTVLEVLSGEAPFSPHKSYRFVQLVRDGVLPGRPHECLDIDDDMWELMKRAWQSKWSDRPSVEEVWSFLANRTARPSNTGASLKKIAIRKPKDDEETDRAESKRAWLDICGSFDVCAWCKTA